jgi:glycosyltransferase A (GT-A) superfamily protein (DUF2064 family)
VSIGIDSRSRAVILFRGDPRLEEKRKHLPRRFLSVLHDSLVRTIRRTPGADLIVASGTGEHFELSCGDATRSINASTFADKVDGAVRFAFDSGYESVLLLAGDIAGLTLPVISDAFDRVEKKPGSVVVGPSGDGGFYLLALTRSAGIDWQKIPWFTTRALAGLVGQLVDRKLACFISPRIDDVDDHASAISVVRSLPASLLKRTLQSILRMPAMPVSVSVCIRERLVVPLLSPRAPPTLS